MHHYSSISKSVCHLLFKYDLSSQIVVNSQATERERRLNELAQDTASLQQLISDQTQGSDKWQRTVKERDAVIEKLQAELRDLKIRMVPLQADAERLPVLRDECATLQAKLAASAHSTTRSSALRQEVKVLRRELDRWKDDAQKSREKCELLEKEKRQLRTVVLQQRKKLREMDGGSVISDDRRMSRDSSFSSSRLLSSPTPPQQPQQRQDSPGTFVII